MKPEGTSGNWKKLVLVCLMCVALVSAIVLVIQFFNS
jgi:hypothetical protein